MALHFTARLPPKSLCGFAPLRVHFRRFRPAFLAGFLAYCLTSRAVAADLQASAQDFFTKHCVACHDGGTKAAGLNLTALAPKLDDAETFDRWVKVYDKVDKQEMPPAGEKRPEPAARIEFLKSLQAELRTANLAKQKAEGRVVLRRLNRVEYENTLHDLLAVDLPLQHFLPEDGTTHGFDNVAEGLRLSMLHIEQYLEAADAAIAEAIDLRRQPDRVERRLRYQDEESFANDQKNKERRMFRPLPDAVVIFDANTPTVLHRWTVRDRGKYRIRIAAAGHQAVGRPVWLKLYATDFKVPKLLGYFDIPAEERREIELVATIEAGHLLNLSPFDTNYDANGQGIYRYSAETYTGRGVAIEWLDVEGPLIDVWPPASLGRLFGDLPVEPVKPIPPGANRQTAIYKIVPEDPRAAAEKTVREFASRAFRRPATPADVERYVKLAHRELDEGLSFVDAMRVAFRAILTSPRFLFLEELPGTLDDWSLASRLSYFLWSTMPDDELQKLAGSGVLHQPAILRGQVERLLNAPQAHAFVENFIGQWLELRQIDFTQPDKKLYPEYDDILKAAMLGETTAFFTELLRNDAKLSNFIHSDFLMLNRCIAEHYNIDGVSGEEFRRVPVPTGSHRGGILTHASVLKVTANGTVSSPVLRGAWVMRHLLGEPPAPPPPGIPAFEPDTRGATTIREQLARHRTLAACASCHATMDPPGFALENFDVIGGWRDRYRAEKGTVSPVKFRGRNVWEYRMGSPVDATGELADGQKFDNIDGFKQLLMQREDQVARNLIQNLLTYGTGAGIQYADRQVVEDILARLKTQGGGLRTVIHEIVQSPTFQSK